jgi:hypothetical protein
VNGAINRRREKPNVPCLKSSNVAMLYNIGGISENLNPACAYTTLEHAVGGMFASRSDFESTL